MSNYIVPIRKGQTLTLCLTIDGDITDRDFRFAMAKSFSQETNDFETISTAGDNPADIIDSVTSKKYIELSSSDTASLDVGMYFWVIEAIIAGTPNVVVPLIPSPADYTDQIQVIQSIP